MIMSWCFTVEGYIEKYQYLYFGHFVGYNIIGLYIKDIATATN